MKLIKKLAVVLTAIMAVVCVAAFTACDKGGETYATTSFNVTVLGEDGNPIDGTKGDEGTKVKLQFCAVTAEGNADACLSGYQPEVGADGKLTVDLSRIKSFVENNDANRFVIHIINLEGQGYSFLANYGVYEVDKVPTEISITLNKNQTEAI